MPYALVTGGSRGIGYAIAAALAKRKYDLILVSRSQPALEMAKNKLEKAYSVRVEILPYDLSLEGSADAVAAWCLEKDIPLKMLCNVTGIGGSKDFLATSLADTQYMLRLNTAPAVSLSSHLIPQLKKNGPAYILNVGSMAGFAPIPVKNIYSATKSAIIFFSYALRYQLKTENISVSCLCPGPVFTTQAIEKDTIEKLGWFGKQMAVAPETVGETAIRKTLKGTMLITPGTLATLTSALLRILPRRWISFIYFKLGSGK